jgi:hypothetical protein
MCAVRHLFGHPEKAVEEMVKETLLPYGGLMNGMGR